MPHTPGPWTHEADGFYGPELSQRGKRAEVLILDDDGACGDPECCGPTSYYISVSEANARLIAAAPDLLEACQKFVDSFKSLQREKCDVAHRMALSAIAKAEGGK